MPNWCENKVYVYGPTEDVDEFFNKCYDNVSRDFQMLEMHLPTPEPKVDESGKETSDWYGWRLDNWGCKWEVESPIEASEEGVFFDTPWSPPIEAFTRLSKDFPGVEFELAYCELGNWFAGVAVMQNGELIDSVAKEDEDIKQIARDIFDYVLEEDIEELV